MKNRLVCECFNIYVEDIKKEMLNGNTTFEKLEKKIKLGVMCSACIKDSKKVIEQLKNELNL
ncbi:MAG: (2Fe-2S)-binding protein [Lachnospirales bacterium]